MTCAGSKQPPARLTVKDVVRWTSHGQPNAKVVAVRGICPVCGADVALSKPRSRRPILRVH